MGKDKTVIGSSVLNTKNQEVKGSYTVINGEDFFKIEHYNNMRPFFMTIVSASDHWLFISSNGALSAGRQNPDNALFPYATDDKITDSVGITGAQTIIRQTKNESVYLWEPFTEPFQSIYKIEANLYKNREGNKIIFEEINHSLGLTFRYGWMFSEQYGIVKKAYLINHSEEETEVEILDGIKNLLPYGVDSTLQNIRSTLVDAYKRNELDVESKLAIYSLSSMIIDTAEPSEALKATTVWSAGIDYQNVLLSALQLRKFSTGETLTEELDIKAEKGAFFIQASLSIAAKNHESWVIVSEVNQSATQIEEIKEKLKDRQSLFDELLDDIQKNKQDLRKKIGLTDGIQLSNDRLSTGRHFSNVLFNIMRGGTFDEQYEIQTSDYIAHVKNMNKAAYTKQKAMLEALPDYISYHQLRHFLIAAKHKNVMRYYLEYLPLSFSRRHGDPSRPWNYFSIETKDKKGNKLRNFEGNWRDIFQNWEALVLSYPEYSMGMIAKFVNASTIDGYNPYRITRDGIDWEIIDPNDPWSHIGYWGDHQIIYLTKFLEISLAYHPHRLKEALNNKIYTYANVPYRIKGYDAIASNPKETIDYDQKLADLIQKRQEQIGSDGKLVWNQNDQLERVNLSEKLLVMTLTKLYNFIPEAGIWLNTQRPEWNDANNALVGNGVSMVTLYYLRRFLELTKELYHDLEFSEIQINKPVADLLDALKRGFMLFEDRIKGSFSNEDRRQFMDHFGIAGEHYRTTAYAGFTGEKRSVQLQGLSEFFELAKKFIEHTIDCNQREDGLYHSYNILSLSDNKAEVSHLYEMLEGQVAILSAKYLKPEATLRVLDALKNSKIYREDQYSYMLYPDRELPIFTQKNILPKALLKESKLADLLLASNDQNIIERDHKGNIHFNGNFHNAQDLQHTLSQFENPEFKKLAKKEEQLFLDAFEKVFDHKSFTGRSGTFYGYEGLGSIYWHMVSKLLLSIQENISLALNGKAAKAVVGNLIEHYYEIRAGIGINKSPELYGAFPTDAYSHTPKHAGAKQPGMTGQVKEDIINRWAELGIRVNEGCLSFDPFILRKLEFTDKEDTLSYYDHEGKACKIKVPENGLAFTYCQVPIVYLRGKQESMNVYYSDGTFIQKKEAKLNVLDSKDVFKRTGKIEVIEVTIKESDLI